MSPPTSPVQRPWEPSGSPTLRNQRGGMGGPSLAGGGSRAVDAQRTMGFSGTKSSRF